MADYTAKSISDMEAAFGGGFVKARAEVGITSFGMQVIRMPPDFGDYPEHDHAHDGQEEAYIALKGSGWIDVEGERVELRPVSSSGSARTPAARCTQGPRASRCSWSAAGPATSTRCPSAPSSRPESPSGGQGGAALQAQRSRRDQLRRRVHVLELHHLDR